MAAGPTREQISIHRRYMLKQAQIKVGGTYIPGLRNRTPKLKHILPDGRECIMTVRILRASNGECAMIPNVQVGTTIVSRLGKWIDLVNEAASA